MGTDYLLSLNSAQVRIPARPCKKVIGELGLGGGFHQVTPVSQNLDLASDMI